MSFFGPPSGLADKRILIIEDTLENLHLFRAILQLDLLQKSQGAPFRGAGILPAFCPPVLFPRETLFASQEEMRRRAGYPRPEKAP